MATQNMFINETQKRIEEWQTQLADLTKQLENAQAQNKAKFEKGIVEMKDSIGQATTMVQQAQQANEKAWNDMEAATKKAFDQLQKGWQQALSRYQ